MRLFGACASDKGSVRSVNQDSIVFLGHRIKTHCLAVLAICDGIGGLSCGEEASRMVKSGIEKWIDSIMEWLTPENIDENILFSHIKDAAEQWNNDVFDYSAVNSINTGTTMSLLMVVDDRFQIIQVGDSRVYGMKDGIMSQLTVDASVTKIKDGKPKAYLENYMGKKAELWFSEMSGKIEEGTLFVVCSDGLYHHLSAEDLEMKPSDMRNERRLEEKCRSLIETMIERGETDNISVGLLFVDV